MTKQYIDVMIPFFHQHGIKKAAIFGSVARAEARGNSDLGLAVSFGKQYTCLI